MFPWRSCLSCPGADRKRVASSRSEAQISACVQEMRGPHHDPPRGLLEWFLGGSCGCVVGPSQPQPAMMGVSLSQPHPKLCDIPPPQLGPALALLVGRLWLKELSFAAPAESCVRAGAALGLPFLLYPFCFL